MRTFGDRFDHNLHALRIVEQFEQRYLDFPGLNLTFEVREGIVKHSHEYGAREFPALAEYLLELRPPLEAQIMDSVDEIAYNTADLDDGREAHLLDQTALCAEVPLFAKCYEEVERAHPDGRSQLKFNEALKRLLDLLATDLIEHTANQTRAAGVTSVEDVRRFPRRIAGFSPAIAEANGVLKQFLRARSAKRRSASRGLRLHRRHDRPVLAATARPTHCRGKLTESLTTRSDTRSRLTASSSISRDLIVARRIRILPITNRPMASAPIANAPIATAPKAPAPFATALLLRFFSSTDSLMA
jgi:hypothetical protein